MPLRDLQHATSRAPVPRFHTAGLRRLPVRTG